MTLDTEDETAQDSAAPLIPRAVLFGDPDRSEPMLSPDGTLLAYAAPYEGVPNIFIEPVDGSAPARPVTADRGRGITHFMLCAGRLVYAQDTGGDENWRLYVVDLPDGEPRLVTPKRGVKARKLAYHPSSRPDQMLVGLNSEAPALVDAYELDLPTGNLTAVEPNPGHDGGPLFFGWLADQDLRVRGGLAPTGDGGVVVHVRDGADGPYRPLITVPGEDFEPLSQISLARDGSALYMVTSLGAPTKRLARIDMASGNITTVAGDPEFDVVEVWLDADTHEPVVAAYAPDRIRYEVLDPAFAADLHRLTALDDGDVRLTRPVPSGPLSRPSMVGRRVLAQTTAPDAPIRYHLDDRETKESRYLFPESDSLACCRLAPTEPICFTARDGREIHGYLTLPVGAPDEPLPAVVRVHGGPWVRDYWELNRGVQLLASRGYAVVQVNYRGSGGYNKDHLNAGDGEWGRAMQHDLLDGVRHLVHEGVIDPARVAISGGSYGGYAALCGAALPDNQGVFCCAVSICGPSDLGTFISTIPEYAKAALPFWYRRVGHPETDAERLRAVSPLTYAADIGIPVLIAQGANDPRVPQAQSDQLVAALQRNGIDHEYLVFPDEGHGLEWAHNRYAWWAAVEKFLASRLRGGYEETSDPPHSAVLVPE